MFSHPFLLPPYPFSLHVHACLSYYYHHCWYPLSSTFNYYVFHHIHVYKCTQEKPYLNRRGEKLVWGEKWVCVNTYLDFRGGNSVYTHFFGGKSRYILIFPGGKLSIYSFFRGEKWVWGKNDYVTPVHSLKNYGPLNSQTTGKEKNSNFNVENCVVMFIYWGTISMYIYV